MNGAPVKVVPVVMAGGSGTRLWPLSRAGYPKQFLVLSGRESLFQQSVRRLGALAEAGLDVAAPIVVGNDDHRFLLLEQLREIGVTAPTLLLEPFGRNTAPALALAALAAEAAGGDPVLVVAPADQTVADVDTFARACREAVRLAAEGGIVTLGIRPDRPETGYGYIQAQHADRASPVRRFVEKPNRATAEGYLAEGGYFWNSGIFVLRASVWREALTRFRPDIAQAVRPAFEQRSHDAAFVRPHLEAFAAVPAESIDYAVMERCPGTDIPIHMVPLDAGWNDLGAWDAVWQAAAKDESGNSCTGDTMVSDSRNTDRKSVV